MSITVPYDPTTTALVHQQLQHFVAWLLADPSAMSEAFGYSNPHPLVLNFLEKCQRLSDSALHARLLEQFGAALQQSTHLDVLGRHLSVALTYPDLSNTQRVRLGCLHVRLLGHRGEVEQAAQVLEATWPAADSHLLQAELYNRLGVLLEIKEEYEASQQAYWQALALAEAEHDLRLLAFVYNNLGNCAYAQDRYEEAVSYFQQAIDVAQEIERSYLAPAEGGMAMTLGEMQRYEEAEYYHQLAHQHYEEAADRVGVLRVALNRCYLARVQKDLEAAKRFASFALVEAKRLGDWQREATALHNLGYVQLQEGEYEAACEHLIQAFDKRRWLGKALYERTSEELIQTMIERVKADSQLNEDLRSPLLQRLSSALGREVGAPTSL